MGKLSAEAKDALSQAVQAIELASAAEIVIAVRPVSTPVLAPSALAACVAGLAGLAFLLFSPWPFSHLAILVDTGLCAWLGGLLCARFSGLRRWATPRHVAEAAVERAAKAEFFERGVHETRDRSGILVYVSQTERLAHVLADRGVLARVEPGAWQRAVDAIVSSVRRSDDGRELAQRVRALAPLLQKALPPRADDVNELEDWA